MLSRGALEAHALEHLRAEGVPVVSPTSPHQPQTLHDVAPAEFGRLLAHVHEAFDGWAPPAGADAWTIDVDALTGHTDRWLRTAYTDLPEEAAAMTAWREQARAAIAAAPRPSDVGLCHGEAYPSTCRLEDEPGSEHEPRLAVAELAWVGPGPRVYDLATYRWVLALHVPDADEASATFDAFIAGYAAHRTPPDLTALDGWVAARHLWSLRLAVGFAPTKQLARRAELARTWTITAAP